MTDPRIHVSLEHLQSLRGPAAGLSFLPRQPSRSALNGRHFSRLRGRGLNFEELRDYLPGDDVRAIDWKTTARTGKPHVRVFTEERDRPALLVVDQRMSMFYGSVHNLKSVTAAEAAALSAFRILHAGDRVGGIVFTEDDRVELAPRRSERTVYALLEAISRANRSLRADKPVNASAGSLNGILEAVGRLAHHDHLVIILSDFDGIDERTERHLGGIAAHNDLILGLVFDPSARSLPNQPEAVLGDGTRQALVNFGDPEVQSAVNAVSAGRLARVEGWQRRINLSLLPLSAGADTLEQLRILLAAAAPERRIR